MKLHCTTLGNPSNPRVVIAHGLFSSSALWLSAGREIAAHGFCVELFDMRNHGESDWSDTMTYPEMAVDLVENIGTEPFIFLGHSMSGKAGMIIACQNAPFLRGLCVVDIAPKQYFPHYENALEWCLALDLNALGSLEQARDILSQRIRNEKFLGLLMTNLFQDKSGQFKWKSNLAAIIKHLSLLPANILGNNDICHIPTLFIGGKNSDYLTAADLPVIKKHFPAAHLELLPAGHNIHLESEEAFVKTFTTWAKGLK